MSKSLLGLSHVYRSIVTWDLFVLYSQRPLDSVLLQLPVVLQHTEFGHAALCALLWVSSNIHTHSHVHLLTEKQKQTGALRHVSQVGVPSAGEEKQKSCSRLIPPPHHWCWWVKNMLSNFIKAEKDCLVKQVKQKFYTCTLIKSENYLTLHV